MVKRFKLNFHLFDDPTPVAQQTHALNPNWTGQGTGVGTYTASQNLSPEMKTFYDKVLIRLATPNLIHDQFGQKRPIPSGNGKTIEFRKFGSLPKATQALTEGITPTGQSVGVYSITATIEQFGAYISTTDMLNLTAFDNVMAEFTKLLGDQAGRTSDTITRDALAAGTNVLFADGKEARSGLAATSVLTIADIKKAVRVLKRNNAPKIGKYYVAIIHPDTTYDLMADTAWIEAAKYAGSEQIFEGEVGKMYGVRFVESTEAKVFGGTVPVYGTLVLGANAFGITSINGGGIETIVKQLGSGGTADPLNQRATVGWKLNKVAKILVEEYMVRIEHAASYGSAVAN